MMCISQIRFAYTMKTHSKNHIMIKVVHDFFKLWCVVCIISNHEPKQLLQLIDSSCSIRFKKHDSIWILIKLNFQLFKFYNVAIRVFNLLKYRKVRKKECGLYFRNRVCLSVFLQQWRQIDRATMSCRQERNLLVTYLFHRWCHFLHCKIICINAETEKYQFNCRKYWYICDN